jgi:hypothetical protein
MKAKREWYNFQIGVNNALTEIFGEDEEPEEKIDETINNNGYKIYLIVKTAT